MANILVVDDEAKIRFILEHTLSQEGYAVDVAADGMEAFKKLSNKTYDLLLLDLHMEPIHGLEVLNFAREKDPYLVIIILTAYSSVESAVEALRHDVFDYLLKPAMPETIRKLVRKGLLQREQALRHHQLLSQIDDLHQTFKTMVIENTHDRPSSLDERYLHSGKFVIDRYQNLVTLDGSKVKLTTTEYDLLICLIKASPDLLSPRQLVNQALGYDCSDTEARDIIKWHIHHLRRKIEDDPARPRHIRTVRHKGYMWRSE